VGKHWKMDAATKAKLSAAATGKRHTAATLKKMSASRKRYWDRVRKGLAALEQRGA
jgi:hypothetical protein